MAFSAPLKLSVSQTGAIEAYFNCTDEARAYVWSEDAALAIYRVIQELIANTIKHSGAKSLSLSLSKVDNRIIIDYSDNGCGVATSSKKGMGTANIVSRLEMLGASWDSQILPAGGFYKRIFVPC